MTAPRNGEKQGGRRWKPGQSGNPAGRPPGARNKATVAIQSLLDGEAERLARKCIELALGGDTTALRLAMERLLPPRRERPITIDLQDAADLPRVTAALLAAVACGELVPGEAETVAKIVEAHRRAVESEALERRIAALEERMKGNGR